MTEIIAFQGEFGAYSQQAIYQAFGRQAKCLACPEFESVFQAVRKQSAQLGLIPVENSLAGSIHQNFDLLREHPLVIVGEVKLRVTHNLLAGNQTKIADIREVYSHPQALSQCSAFFRKHRHLKPMPYFDTAAAARYVSELGRKDVAAIASSQAAKHYGLKALKVALENNEQNFTRFLLIAKSAKKMPAAKKSSCYKTSVVFAFKNIPGALFKCLSIFAIREIDLFKIESRPLSGSPWQYLFYLDLRGSADDEGIKASLRHLKEITSYIKVLGSYPASPE